jgi:hypothetical protein
MEAAEGAGAGPTRKNCSPLHSDAAEKAAGRAGEANGLKDASGR